MERNSGSQIKKLRAEAQVLLDERGMATVDEAQLHPVKKFVHFWVLVGQNFVRNRCPVRCSARAYTTLLALIPLLAVGLGVSTKLLQSSDKQKEKLIQTLVDELAPQLGLVPVSEEEKAEVRRSVAEKIEKALPTLLQSNATRRADQVNQLAAELVTKKEAAVPGKDENEEYRQKVAGQILKIIPRLAKGDEQRRARLTGKVVDDLTAWTLRASRGQDETSRKVVETIQSFIANVHSGALGLTGTVALVVILVMGLAVGSQFQVAQDFIEETPVIGGLVFKMIPFFVLCGSFLLLYQLMPNTKVHWKAALVGGAVAAVLWVANGKFNALFASKVVSASKIYGSLSAIPIFLFGLYLSWTILLFGAHVSYAFQNRRAYIQEKQAESVNQRGREFIALRVMTLVGQRFHRGEKPPTATEISEGL